MDTCRDIAVVCDHLVAQCQFDDDGQIVDIDILQSAQPHLVAFEDDGYRLHLVVLAREKQDESVLRELVPESWDVHPICSSLSPKSLKHLWKALGDSTILIASDRSIRAAALRRGLSVAADPVSARMLLEHSHPEFVCLRGDVQEFSDRHDFLPYFIEKRLCGNTLAFGVLPKKELARAIVFGLEVTVLPLDFDCEDALLVHLDDRGEASARALSGLRILWAEEQRLLIAIGPETETDDIGVHGAHGHYFALAPNAELLRTVNGQEQYLAADELALARLPPKHLPYERIIPELELPVRPPVCPGNAAQFQLIVDRFSGVSPLDSTGPILSRHSRHPDNQRAVDALVGELNDMGYCAFRHSFLHNGNVLQNVIADLPGRGRYSIAPSILEKLRKLLARKHYRNGPIGSWLDPIEEILGKEWIREQRLREMHPLLARHRLERALFLHPWYPWRFRLCPLYRPGAELVLVGCHLDSTANFSSGYDPLTDSAPGADDDASGIAATLSMASWFMNHYAGKLTHTLRFCFFNAEESGLVGSKAYAAHLKSCSAPIRAVVCADMIGYNSDANRIFEIHAGYTDASVRDASVPYAEIIEAWAATLGQLAPAQIYRGTSSAGAPDRDVYDGAINRSDHAAFHEQGYPAVLVSEDFFANLASEPGNDPNPDYHRQGDTIIDADYAADIVCATAQAVRDIAA